MPPSAVPKRIAISQGNTQILTLYGLMDITTGDFLSDASLSAQVVDKDGNVVLSGISLNYINNSNGNYSGVIPGTFNAAVGCDYRTIISGSEGGSDFQLTIWTDVIVRTS